MNQFTAKILSVQNEASGVKTFVIEKPEGFDFEPGQFCWISLPNFKPSPMAIASGNRDNNLEFSIRAWGDLTMELFKKSSGDSVEVDGPYGSYFPVESVNEDTNLLFIAGGTGITPVRSLTKSLGSKGNKSVYYGAKSPKELLYIDEIHHWDADIMLTVDNADENWSGKIGLVSELLQDTTFTQQDLFFVCGPKSMEAAVIDFLRNKGIKEKNIFVSLEKFDGEGNVVGPVLAVTSSEVEF